MKKTIKSITLTKNNYPDVIDVINRLAKLEDRRPHDTAERLIIRFGNDLINSYKKNDHARAQQ